MIVLNLFILILRIKTISILISDNWFMDSYPLFFFTNSVLRSVIFYFICQVLLVCGSWNEGLLLFKLWPLTLGWGNIANAQPTDKSLLLEYSNVHKIKAYLKLSWKIKLLSIKNCLNKLFRKEFHFQTFSKKAVLNFFRAKKLKNIFLLPNRPIFAWKSFWSIKTHFLSSLIQS